MSLIRLREVAATIAAGTTRSFTFRNDRVLGRAVFVFNFGPGTISVTRSVSADGITFTILPGAVTILPGRSALITLPAFAVFTRLNLTAINLRATVVLAWFKRHSHTHLKHLKHLKHHR